jgi:hypothetical protein
MHPALKSLSAKSLAVKSLVALMAAATLATLVACTDADVASHNLSVAADNFAVNRRIVFYNGITGGYILSIEGLCALGNQDQPHELSVTCKTGPDAYKKHFLGLSDNVTYFAQQLDPQPAGLAHYAVVFKPSVIAPDVQIK